MTSAEIRADLVRALKLDLIGPEPGSEHESEVLPYPPTRWYLTGFLVPYEAPESQRRDAVSDEEIDALTLTPGTDDDERPERASGRKVFLPSSLGISVLVPPPTKSLHVTASWGDYKMLEEKGEPGGAGSPGGGRSNSAWK